MLFSSISFLYYFLPIVLTLYFITPKKLKNSVLLLSSLFFYAWGEPKYVFLMLLTVGIGYIFGILTEKYRGKSYAKVFTAVPVLFDLGALAYFKYFDFFAENFNRLTGLSVPVLNIALPIGISFYTFQILSYSIDVYRGTVKAQKNPINLATYVALFPQLIAGPIVRYCDIEKQLVKRTHSFEKTAYGIRRFVLGLAKKIIIANSLGSLATDFLASGEKTILFYWIYAVAFMLQIYFDFSGYSDMAIGLGKILGFDFMENFNYPFISKSVSEFWRRWHISLGSWFRDYVYIPMGGNRVSNLKFFINIFTVWFLTGFWHGAEWNFIIWGLYFGAVLIIEKFFLTDLLKKHKIAGHIYTVFIAIISFALFSGNSLSEAFSNLGGMFGVGGIPVISRETIFALKNYGFLILISIIGATPLPQKAVIYLRKTKYGRIVTDIAEIPVLIILTAVATAYLADGSFNPFLYFRF